MEKKYKRCQSCNMPLKQDKFGGGSNADGSISTVYCSNCWGKGKFIHNCTLDEMKTIVKGKLKKMGFPNFFCWFFTIGMKDLKRWKNRK